MIPRDPPDLTREQARELLFEWLTLEALEPLRRQMPAGATLEDALRLHRAMAQYDRRPSKVMQEDELDLRR